MRAIPHFFKSSTILCIPTYNEKAAYINHLKSNKDTTENAMKKEIKVFELLKKEGVSFVS